MSVGRVLFLEDDPSARVTLGAILGDDYAVDAVGTSAEALRALASGTWDVVIADYDLGEPLTTGAQVLERAHALHPGLSTILLTGHTNYPEVREVQRQGRSLVLFKPVDADQLLAWVKNGVAMTRLFRTRQAHDSRRVARPARGEAG